MRDLAALKIPPVDGAILIEPPYRACRSLVDENRAHTSGYSFTISGLDYPSYREQVRRQLAVSSDKPVIVWGHQPEFYHCGVWAKGVIGQLMVDQLGADAVQICIDYDKLKQRRLQVPIVQQGRVAPAGIAIQAQDRAELYEDFPAWSAADMQHFEQQFAALNSPCVTNSLMPELLQGFKQALAPRDWVSQYNFALRVIDSTFGLRVPTRRASELDYRGFFAALIADAERFASCYNRALHQYRRQQRIKGTRHPVPDLQIQAHRVELPIWIYRRGHPRERLFAGPGGMGLQVFAGQAPVAEVDPATISTWDGALAFMNRLTNEYELRPRALTFTLWARLFAADFFIHGIGGAKYDCMTDHIIRHYFGVEPPHYGCLSATLWLDLPRYAVTLEEIRQLRHQLRDLQFNPQRYLGPADPLDDLLTRRQALIAESSRLRSEDPGARQERRRIYRDIRSANALLGEHEPTLALKLQERLGECEWRLQSNQHANSRESFYCLYSRKQLAELQDRICSQALGS